MKLNLKELCLTMPKSGFSWPLYIGSVAFIISSGFTELVLSVSQGMYMSDEALSELRLNQQEKLAFDQLKAVVFNDIQYDFIKTDLFLLRYIRAKDLDVNKAVRDMKNFIKENKIDTILKEDWSDMEQDFPFYANLTDKRGRPVAYGNLGKGWNIRRGILQGKRERLMRYTYKIVFEMYDKVIKTGRHQPNITQFVIITNLENFNPFEHLCPLCVSTYANLLQSYERFLPGYAHEFIALNAPQAYLVLVEMMKPFLSKSTRNALKVFGSNRNRWKQFLDARIDSRLLEQIDDMD